MFCVMLSLYYQGQKKICLLKLELSMIFQDLLNLLAQVHIYQQLLPSFFHATQYNLSAGFFPH